MSESKIPQRPTDLSLQQAGFEIKPMVDWFNPIQLTKTGLQVGISSLFGSYADKRELMAFSAQPVFDYSERDTLWLDYAADLGDGFNSTYTIASLLGSSELEIDGMEESLPRGDVLLLGGDEVYPVATREEYSNRLIGPYKAALPWIEDEKKRPHLFALPGNHDWYDGLTNFTRLFHQGRGIGGWKMPQSRSYFALRLPHGWWMWGVDVQLSSDIDQPQIDYFNQIADEQMEPGDRVILCSAEPSWVYHALGDEGAMRNLKYFREQIIAKHKGRVALMLAGDLHHYCHYQACNEESHRITCGGGGAFLHGTHNLPEELPAEQADDGGYTCEALFPDAGTSRSLTWDNLKFPFTNRAFSLFMGCFYLLYAWMLESTSLGLSGDYFPGSLSAHFAQIPLTLEGVWEVIGSYLSILIVSPSNLMLGLVLLLGMYTFVEAPPQYSQRIKWLIGLGHGVGHLMLNLLLFWSMVQLNEEWLGLELKGFSGSVLFIFEMVFIGAFCAGFAMGLHLLLSNLWLGYNRTSSFSSLRVADYKSFLRLHIDAKGLTIYPVAVDKVARSWRAAPDAAPDSPWFTPTDGPIGLRLIEQPIHIPSKES